MKTKHGSTSTLDRREMTQDGEEERGGWRMKRMKRRRCRGAPHGEEQQYLVAGEAMSTTTTTKTMTAAGTNKLWVDCVPV